MILLDGITIYNPYHFASSSGIFNLYAIKNIELLVGGFGAEYGGRNSSVLYITTKEGNNKKLHGEIKPSTSQTSAVFDFPVGKNGTMMVSGRVYYSLPARFIFYSSSYFYDMNISYNSKINKFNKLTVKYFYSKDNYDYSLKRYSTYLTSTFETDIFDNYDVVMKNIWNNQAVTVILKTILSPKVYLNTQVYGSFFSSENLSVFDFEYFDTTTNENIKLSYRTDFRNKIQDLCAKSVLNVKLNTANTLKIGSEYNNYFFTNDIRINNFDEGKTTRKPSLLSGFLENKFSYGPLILRTGVRFSKFSFSNKEYYAPRINFVVKLPFDLKFKAAWGKYYQYIISINSQDYEISQFIDNYYPLKDAVPSASIHYIAGFEKRLTKKSQLSIDFYYKKLSKTYTYDANMSKADVLSFSDRIKAGNGEAYGIEILWKGSWKNFSGWLSYGLSRSLRSYQHIDNGKEFLFDYDRNHSFKAIVNHQVTKALSYSGTLRVLSGVPKTIETSVKSFYYYEPGNNEIASYPSYVSNKKNNARLPAFIRLDFGIKKEIRKGFGAELAEFLHADKSYLIVSFENILFFRRNVLMYFPTGNEEYYALGTNYFPGINVGYTIKF